MQHRLNLRRPQQENGALGQQLDGHRGRESRQLSIGRLIDHQVAGAIDLDGQVATLRHIQGDLQQRFAVAVGDLRDAGNQS